ncbi:MAG TPA: hypothetical protein VGZ47_09510 [Gemmataceae bacterium]|jgi:hypothetical protein|nr:hypothetical protein [Gemmataceae bacterium]
MEKHSDFHPIFQLGESGEFQILGETGNLEKKPVTKEGVRPINRVGKAISKDGQSQRFPFCGNSKSSKPAKIFVSARFEHCGKPSEINNLGQTGRRRFALTQSRTWLQSKTVVRLATPV